MKRAQQFLWIVVVVLIVLICLYAVFSNLFKSKQNGQNQGMETKANMVASQAGANPILLLTSSGFPVEVLGCTRTPFNIVAGVPPQACTPVTQGNTASLFLSQNIGNQPNPICNLDFVLNGSNWQLQRSSTCKTAMDLKTGAIRVDAFLGNGMAPVTISNKYFYKMVSVPSGGAIPERFMIRGIDFQPNDGVDPLMDVNGGPNPIVQSLLAYSPRLQQQGYGFLGLNINAIRVYQVDPGKTHQQTMNLLAQNGIYVLVGLADSAVNIPQCVGTPSPQCPQNAADAYYLPTFQARIDGIIDEFQQYPNVLSFEAGNELADPGDPSFNSTSEFSSVSALKMAALDAKAYINSQHYRQIPVGVAERDVTCPPAGNCQNGQVGTNTIAQYYICPSTVAQGTNWMDYIGINTYRYMPGGSPATATYEQLISDYNITQYNAPVIFTEYEANVCPPTIRDFLDVLPIYQVTQLSNQLSGGFAFRFLSREWGVNPSCNPAPFGLVYLPGWQPTTPFTAADVNKLQPIANQGYSSLQTAYLQAQAQGRGTLLASSNFLNPPPSATTVCPANFAPPVCALGTGNAIFNSGNGSWSCVCPTNPSVGSATCPATGTIKITVQNKGVLSGAQRTAIVAQNNAVLQVLADANQHTVYVNASQPLYIQQNSVYDQICMVPANTLVTGNTVTANWGNCVVS